MPPLATATVDDVVTNPAAAICDITSRMMLSSCDTTWTEPTSEMPPTSVFWSGSVSHWATVSFEIAASYTLKPRVRRVSLMAFCVPPKYPLLLLGADRDGAATGAGADMRGTAACGWAKKLSGRDMGIGAGR